LKDSKLKIYQTIEAGKANRNEFDKLNAEIELLKNEINKMKVGK
jgi:cell division protein FtsB